MLQTVERKPIASARTPEACDFTDRLGQIKHDVLLIELAAQTACKDGDEAGGTAIVMACRKLQAEIDDLAEQVLPPLSEDEIARIESIVGRGRL